MYMMGANCLCCIGSCWQTRDCKKLLSNGTMLLQTCGFRLVTRLAETVWQSIFYKCTCKQAIHCNCLTGTLDESTYTRVMLSVFEV